MGTSRTSVSLTDELAAIARGKCVWCDMGMPHPTYSGCRHGESGDSVPRYGIMPIGVLPDRSDSVAPESLNMPAAPTPDH